MPEETELDDRALLEAWRAGDRELGNQLFRRHVAGISRFFRSKVPDSAEDLTQKTFLALLESADRFRGDASFRTFLFAIARKQLLMHLRTTTRAGARFDPLTWSAADSGAGPARLVAKEQQDRLVARALQCVPIDYQVALELHYFEELQVAEVAEVLEVAVGTVKSRLARGRALLKEALAKAAPSAALLESAVSELDRWMKTVAGSLRGPSAEE